MKKRDDFDQKVREILAKRVGFTCSNPDCRTSTIGPSSSDPMKFNFVGIASHIYSASPDNGPRANKNLSEEERSSVNNGIHLCAKCALLIDKNNGEDYPVELLYEWKHQAEKEATRRLYKYIPEKHWKCIKYDNLENDYSTALTCSGLNERHVRSCPENFSVKNFVIKRLALSRICAITGESGTGKTILTFQIAYAYYLDGWDVFKFINTKNTKDIIRPVPTNENIILIIDDAQNISFETLQLLLDLVADNVFVILNWNLTTERDISFLKSIPTIQINNKEQVSLLRGYCLKHKDEISKKIRKFDEHIGEYPLQTSIESKIEIAAREKTSWLFNYSLTNGWKQAKYDIELLKSKGRIDVVITTIALFQIITLDDGIDEKKVITEIRRYSNEIKYLEDAKNAIKEYCIIDNKKIRLKHYEYARRIVTNFIPEKDSKVIEYFETTCRRLIENTEYKTGLYSFLDLLLFDSKPTIYYLKKLGVFDQILGRYLTLDNLSDNDVLAVNAILRTDNSLLKKLEGNSIVVEKWFRNIDTNNLLGFSKFINQLYTDKYSKTFISSAFLEKLTIGLQSDKLYVVYKYSTVLERLHLYLHEDKYENYRKSLREIDVASVSKNVIDENLYYTSEILKALLYVDKEASQKYFLKNLKYLIECFNSDPLEFHTMAHSIINDCFGLISIILGGYRKHKKIFLTKEAVLLSKEIDTSVLLTCTNKMSIRESSQLSDIFLYLYVYNKSKINSIVDKIDYSYIENLFKNEEVCSHEHKVFIISLYRANPESLNLNSYVEKLVSRYKKIISIFLIIKPDFCINLISNNSDVSIVFEDNSEYELFNSLIDEFSDKREKQLQVINLNRNYVFNCIFSLSINIDNNGEKITFLKKLLNSYFDILMDMFTDENVLKLISKIKRLAIGKRNEKITAAIYAEMIFKSNKEYHKDILALRRKYPRTLNVNNFQ